MRARDGSILQAGVRMRGLEGSAQGGPRSYPFPEMGVVVAVYPKDHENSAGKSYLECDVFLPRLAVPLWNVPVSFPVLGEDNGVQWILKGSSTPLDMSNPNIEEIEKSDGDRVVVDFLGGFQPVIRSSLPRVRPTPLSYSPAKADGAMYSSRHGGTTVKVLPSGEVQVELAGGAPFRVQQVNSVFRINVDGSIDILTPDGLDVVTLGDVTAELVPLVSLLVSAFNSHTHPAPGGATSPPTVPWTSATIQGSKVKVK